MAKIKVTFDIEEASYKDFKILSQQKDLKVGEHLTMLIERELKNG